LLTCGIQAKDKYHANFIEGVQNALQGYRKVINVMNDKPDNPGLEGSKLPDEKKKMHIYISEDRSYLRQAEQEAVNELRQELTEEEFKKHPLILALKKAGLLPIEIDDDKPLHPDKNE
jgi:hypothetical protein